MNCIGLRAVCGRELVILLIGFVLGAATIVGCGGGKKGTPSSADGGGEAEEPADDGAGQSANVATNSKKKGSPQSKRPMIGDIPLDVWLDDPLAVAATKGNVAAAKTAPAANSTPAATSEKPAPTEAPAAAASGGDDWKSLMPGEVLADETKQVRLRLNQALSSVQLYNGRYKDIIQGDGAELAALAGVVTLAKPDGVSWKDNAHLVREFAMQVADNAKGLGQAPYDKTKESFESLDGLLSGNKPANIPDGIAPTVPFTEVAKTKYLMRRMQRAYDSMKSSVSSEALLKKETEVVVRESAVLSVMAKVIGSEGYSGADEDDYKKFVKEMLEGSRQISEAAKTENLQGFNDGMNRVNKACNECHPLYRTSN